MSEKEEGEAREEGVSGGLGEREGREKDERERKEREEEGEGNARKGLLRPTEVCVSMMVKTEWERLLRSFIPVAAVARNLFPRLIQCYSNQKNIENCQHYHLLKQATHREYID